MSSIGCYIGPKTPASTLSVMPEALAKSGARVPAIGVLERRLSGATRQGGSDAGPSNWRATEPLATDSA